MAGILTALLSGALMSIQGVFQHGGDETDEYMAGGRLGADQCVCRLSCGMVALPGGSRSGICSRVKPWVSAARRCNWRVYHDHGYLEYGRARPGEGGDADRHFPATQRRG